jgi:hypothetical protein
MTALHVASAEVDGFLATRGIDPEIWAARGCCRYQKGDSWVKEHFRRFLPPTRLGTVTRIVNQCDGWLMPKHAPAGFPPIPPQLRPDRPVIVDGRTTWHYHGEKTESWPVFPEAAGSAAGKNLPPQRIMYGARAAAHVDATGDVYDPETGLGEHNGQPVDVVHQHAPREAKYVLLGEGSRLDLHPFAAQLLPEAKVVFFVLEGTPKTDAVLSAGGVAFGVPSVTLWTRRELGTFAERHLHGKTALIVPDADWATNSQVERQALKVRTVLRRLGIAAYVCAPPTDGNPYHKGVDDFLGAGKTLGELVIDGREPPIGRIWEAVQGVPYQRRRSAAYALENLSLYVNAEGRLTVSFPTLKRLLDIRDSNRLLPLLEAIEHTFTVEHGSLQTIQRPTFYGRYTETVWKEPPTISLDDYYQSYRQRARLLTADFWKETAIELLRAEVDELKRWQRDFDQREAG